MGTGISWTREDIQHLSQATEFHFETYLLVSILALAKYYLGLDCFIKVFL